jgi:hypothetical protein
MKWHPSKNIYKTMQTCKKERTTALCEVKKCLVIVIMSDKENRNAPAGADKWRYSIYSAILFVIVSLPVTYKLTSNLYAGILTKSGCPSIIGVLLHATVFLVIIRLMMNFDI